MFFQSPDEETNRSKTISKTLKSNARSRKQKRLRRKNRLKAIRKRQNQIRSEKKAQLPDPIPTVPIIPSTMTTWAEDFTKAATWQLKNEVAYWKSKAKALEQENRILHRTIRQNIIDAEVDENKRHQASQHETYLADLQDSEDEQEEEQESDQDDEEEKAGPESVASGQDQFEVSEEFIQFLRDNQKYRDSARQERERMKAKNDAEKTEIEEMEAGPAEQSENQQETLKKLYGDGWERISALEMYLRTQFISICDEDKPMYWPNIPFNFNFG